MKKVNLLSRAEMKKVMGGVPPIDGTCTAICRDKDMKVLSPDGGISVEACGSTALSACTAEYKDTDSVGCWCE